MTIIQISYVEFIVVRLIVLLLSEWLYEKPRTQMVKIIVNDLPLPIIIAWQVTANERSWKFVASVTSVGGNHA